MQYLNSLFKFPGHINLWGSKVSFALLGIVLLFLFVAPNVSQAQVNNKKDLKRKRRALTARIKTTSDLLESSRKNKEAALDRLVAFQKQIEQREKLIKLLDIEIQQADESVERTRLVLGSLQQTVDTLSDTYNKMLRASLRNKLLKNKATFVLSAKSLSESFRRFRYVRRFAESRKRQLELIDKTKASLATKIKRLDTVRRKKLEFVLNAKQQNALLDKEIETKNKIVEELKKDENSLKLKLKKQTKQKEELDKTIAGAIENNAKKDVALSSKNVRSEKKELSTDFKRFRGKLPWPVKSGYVSKPFGKRKHPTLKKVFINNNGVDIMTQKGAEVKAVFEGKVVGMQKVPGYNTMIILQHGDYYTVYSNVVEVKVKVGARVGSLDKLGNVAEDKLTGNSELHFEVWKSKTTKNPKRWIKGLD